MPVVNPLARELVFKIVYYGPGLGGKTTTLQYIHATTKPEHRGRMVSLATPVDRTLYFDFLPIRVPNVRDMGVRLQLFTVPGQVYYNATRKLVLTGSDGVVFVADSQRARLDANLESWENLRDNLREHGRILAEMPHVLQFNKRDLPDLVDISELEEALNRHQAPTLATVATTGVGVYEALEAITRAVLADFEGRMPGEQDHSGHALQVPEGGLAEALRRADGGGAQESVPRARGSTPVPAQQPEVSPSGLFRLSLVPELDAGEKAARVLTDGRYALPQPAVPSEPEATEDGVAVTAAGSAKSSPEPSESSMLPAETSPSPALVGGSGSLREERPSAVLSEPELGTIPQRSLPSAASAGAVSAASLGASAAEEAPLRDSPWSPAARENTSEAKARDAQRATARHADLEPGVPSAEDPGAAATALGTESSPGMPRPAAPGASFAQLWSPAERNWVLELEMALGAEDYARVVLTAEKLVTRLLASAANVLGSTADAPRDPTLMALLLGVPGPRVLEFRALVREVRTGRGITHRAALCAYAFAIELNLAKARVVG